MSSYAVETNSIVLAEFGSGAEQIGTKEAINENSMSTINSVSSGEGYVQFAKSNPQLEAVLTKSILTNGINSLTVEYTPVSSGNTVISEVINASNSHVLAKTVTKGSTHQNNVVLGFTGGDNNYLRVSTDGLSIRLHRLLGNVSEPGPTTFLKIMVDKVASQIDGTSQIDGYVGLTEIRLTTNKGQTIEYNNLSLLEGGAATLDTSVFKARRNGSVVGWGPNGPVGIFNGTNNGNDNTYTNDTGAYPVDFKGRLFAILRMSEPVYIENVEWYNHSRHDLALNHGATRVRVVGTNKDITGEDNVDTTFAADGETLLDSDDVLMTDKFANTNMYARPNATDTSIVTWSDSDKYLVGWS